MVTNNKKVDRRGQKNHLKSNKTALFLLDILIDCETDKYKKEQLLAVRKEVCKL